MENGNEMIRIEHLRKRYGDLQVLDDINLTIKRGEKLVILGPSGSGKSTLIRCINHLEKPTSGEIYIGGELVTQKNWIQMSRDHMAMVFQQFNLYPHKTVLQNLTMAPIKLHKVPKKEAEKTAMEYLDRVGLANKADAYPQNLSGGQQQRVALARAIISRPKVLLLDEPLSAIDAKLRKNLQIEIRRIQQELNITTIFVTHDQDEAMSMSDRICLLNNGNIEQVSNPIELYTKPKTRFAASFIGHYNVFSPDEFKQAFHVAAPDNKMTAIRPETIQISTEKPQENDAIHTIYGKIINNRSVGNTLHYHIDVNGITFKVDTLFRSFALYKNDQNVWLSLEKRNCLALED